MIIGWEIRVSSCLPEDPYLEAWMWLSPAPAPSWALAIQTGGQWAAQPMCRGLFSLPTSTVWIVRRGPGQPPDDSETPLSVPLESDIPITTSPADKLLPAGTGICYPSQSPAASCPQEQLLPSTPTRLEIAFLCCKFSPTPSQVIVDVDLLLISNLGSNQL